MLAAGTGDPDAFRELVVAHQRGAWGVASRFLGDPAEAEDVAQEAFLKILAAAPRYRPTAPFRAYLYQVVTRLCLDRAEKKRPEYTDALPEVADTAPDPAQALIGREREAAVRNALAALPDTQRMAVILKHFQDLSYAEIAEALGVSAKAVEGLLGRARSALHLRLAPLERG
ncbi:MAG: sigma-70 family RNA polymerase sigma factor [Deltaproteobacteria bacterium]|nr:sigma-70 family RNA polymerase sigma factor [Deltaproteobacteria bacterium]